MFSRLHFLFLQSLLPLYFHTFLYFSTFLTFRQLISRVSFFISLLFLFVFSSSSPLLLCLPLLLLLFCFIFPVFLSYFMFQSNYPSRQPLPSFIFSFYFSYLFYTSVPFPLSSSISIYLSVLPFTLLCLLLNGFTGIAMHSGSKRFNNNPSIST